MNENIDEYMDDDILEEDTEDMEEDIDTRRSMDYTEEYYDIEIK